MYTSYIGKKFLKLYKEKSKKADEYSAQQFFDEVMFPLFFDDEQHLMHVSNSPFFQKPRQEDVEKCGSKSLAQYNNLKNAIENEPPNMSIYVGYAAKDIGGTTSGQLTDMDFKTNSEDVYASWIGEALSIGVSGGFVVLIDESEILYAVFEGWKYYRKYIQQSPNLKDKQVETWNGQWLCHRISKRYKEDRPFDNFEVETAEVLGKLAIPTKQWSQIIFVLAQKYPNKIFTAYSYNLSQTNTTLGFINLYLPEVSEIYNLRDKLFIDYKDTILKDEQIERLETFFTFKNACKLGSIGLKSIEPAKLREYMPIGSKEYARGQDFKFTDEKSYLNYSLYKLWIIAMLNKTELLDLATQLAATLLEIEAKKKEEGNRGKTTLSQDIESVKNAKNLRFFIDALTPFTNVNNADLFANVVEQVLKMPIDNFPLFITLVRFEIAYLNLKSKK
jgi:hypothetical protein